MPDDEEAYPAQFPPIREGAKQEHERAIRLSVLCWALFTHNVYSFVDILICLNNIIFLYIPLSGIHWMRTGNRDFASKVALKSECLLIF